VYTPGIEGTGTAVLTLILVLKGYRVRGAVGVDMPSNWLAVHPGLSPQAVAGIVQRAEGRVADLMDRILSGGRRFQGWIPLLVGLYFFHISLAYLFIGRLFLAKMLYASDHCDGCTLCAASCPNGGIKMVGSGERRRPYWTFRCESCMRCMAYCPTRAVEANYLLGVGVYVLAAAIPTATMVSWLKGWIPGLDWSSGIPGLALETVYAIGILGLAYPLFHLLLGVGWVNRLLTLITPTHYYRRYHMPDATLGDLRRGGDSGGQ
jgi:Pyruvate/2-oxoacid:ferredoxin oxidoreductase delta subunit